MRHWLIYLELTLTALFWGLTFNAAHLTAASLTPLAAAGMRFGIAAACAVAILLTLQKGWWTELSNNAWAFVAMAATGVAMFNVLFFFGLKYTSPINGALIMATNPLVTALMAWLCLGEPISRSHKLGSFISFAGVVALILLGAQGRLQGINAGDLLIMGCTVMLALYGIINKRFVKASTPLTTTCITTTMGAIMLLAMSYWLEPGAITFQLPATIWAALLFMGVCGSVLAFVFWNRGFRAIGVANTVLFYHLVPVFAVLGSFALGQTVSWQQMVAGVVVIAGVMVSTGALKRLLGE